MRSFAGMFGALLGVTLGAVVLLLGVFNAGISAPPVAYAGSAAASCGNGVIDPGEQCDPPGSSCTGAFSGQTCQTDCTCSGGSAVSAVLHHFQCYEVRPPQRFDDRTVSLDDQFRSFDATLRKVFSVCAPADKNGEDSSAVGAILHLTNYGIKATSKGPKVFNQKVTNQFGTLNLDVVKPARLLVPSTKSLSGPPASAAGGTLNHFSCYKVKRTKGSAKFAKQTATIQTQFETVAVNITKPLRLCAPVSKNGEPVNTSPPGTNDHLLCYRIKASTGFPTTNVFVNNQFGQQAYPLSQRREFCVPSTKNQGGSPSGAFLDD